MLDRVWQSDATVSLAWHACRPCVHQELPLASVLTGTVSYRSYLIQNGIVYLTIAEKSYPRKLAFSYLDELSKEFERSYAGVLPSPV